MALNNGLDLGIAVAKARGLLVQRPPSCPLEITPTALGLHWPNLEEDLELPSFGSLRPVWEQSRSVMASTVLRPGTKKQAHGPVCHGALSKDGIAGVNSPRNTSTSTAVDGAIR